MVKVRVDLTGQTFGRWTVLERAEDYIEPGRGISRASWLCECSCDNHTRKIITGNQLTMSNGTKSCGCLRRELLSKRSSKQNEMDLNLTDEYGEYGIGYCTNTNAKFYFDMDDYDKIKNYCWTEHVDKKGYHYVSTINKDTGKDVRMHWLIAGKYYDHKDRDALNNRRHNLRQCTIYENNQNRSIRKDNKSGFIGVREDIKTQRWDAYIGRNNKTEYLGRFVNKNDAVKARLEAEAKYYGEFAPQQHLFEEYGIIS